MALNNMGLGFNISARDDASPALDNVAGKLTKTDKAAKAAKVSFEDIGSEAGAIGKKFTMVGVGGAAALGFAANESMKFHSSVAEVMSITTRAAFPISEIERIGKEMASTYGGDLNQQVKTLYQAASSGATNAAEASALMTEANKLAVAGFTDSFKAVDAITNVLNAYGMQMTDAEKVSDAMFVTAKVGKTTIDELATQIGRVAPTAASVGVSMDDMMSVIAGASTQLGNGTAAIDGLKEGLANIINPSKDASDEAARLGIKFDAATLRAKGFNGFLKQITGSAKYNADTMGKLFGSMTAYNTMSALAANGGKNFNDSLDAMAKKKGAAGDAFNTIAETGAFAATVLKSNLQVALVGIGDSIAPTIGVFVTMMNNLLKKFNASPPIVKKIVAGILVFGTVAALATGALLGLVAAVTAVAFAGEAALIAAAAAVGLFGQLIVVAAVAAAVFYLFKRAYEENLGGFADFVDRTYTKVKLAFDGLTQLFSDGAFSGAVMTDMAKAENGGIKAFAITVFMWFSRIKNYFVGIGEGFSSVMATLGPAFTRLVAAIREIGAALGFVQEGPVEAAESFDAFGKMGERVGAIIGGVATFLIDVFTGVAQAVKWVVKSFSFMRSTGPGLGSALGSLFDSFTRLGEALGIVSKTGTSTTSVWAILGGVIGTVVGVIVNTIVMLINVFAAVLAIVSSVVGGVIGMFQGLWNFIEGFVMVVYGLMTGNWKMVWDGAKLMVFGFVQFVLNALNGLVGAVFSIVDKITGAFGKATNLTAQLNKEKDSLLNSTQQGLGIQTAVGGQDRRALPVVGGAAPATAGAAQAAANAAGGAGGPPTQVTAVTTIQLDGEKVGEAVTKHQAANGARSGAPTPAAT